MDYFIGGVFVLGGATLTAVGLLALRKPSMFDAASASMYEGLARDRPTALRYLGRIFIIGGMVFGGFGALLLALATRT